MWGGTPARNMVSDAKGLPTSFDPGEDRPGKTTRPATTNIKWTAQLGTQTFGTPTVGRQGVRRHQQRAPARREVRRRPRRGDVLPPARRGVPLATGGAQAQGTGLLQWRLRQSRHLARLPTLDGDRVTWSPPAATCCAWMPTAWPTATTGPSPTRACCWPNRRRRRSLLTPTASASSASPATPSLWGPTTRTLSGGTT